MTLLVSSSLDMRGKRFSAVGDRAFLVGTANLPLPCLEQTTTPPQYRTVAESFLQ